MGDPLALRRRVQSLESHVPLEVWGQTSCRSVRLRPRAPLCRREAIGYRKWSTSDQPDRLALTGGSAAGCKRGLAVPGFRTYRLTPCLPAVCRVGVSSTPSGSVGQTSRLDTGDSVAEHSDHIRLRVIRFSGSPAECAEFTLGAGRSRMRGYG